MRKRVLMLILAAAMCVPFTACGGASNGSSTQIEQKEPETLGQAVLQVFYKNADKSTEEIANAILESDVIDFGGAAMPVEEGFLTGFNNMEIAGFKEGTMFAPMIGSIPFVGYIFTVDDNKDIDEFMAVLKDNADPRWNICTEADETIVEKSGDKVFFLMCPKSLDEE